jgi:dihydropyrimidinase
MPGADLNVTNARVVVPEVGVIPGNLIVRDGKVVRIHQGPSKGIRGPDEIDAQGRYVLPGLVDPHDHSGLLAPLEQRLESESAFAASGGVTTIIRYFRRAESYLDTVSAQVDVESRLSHQDFAFHLALFGAHQVAEMGRYIREFGVTSFKVHTNLRGEYGRGAPMDAIPGEAASSHSDVDFTYGHLYDVFKIASLQPAAVRINVHAEDAEIVSRGLERARESQMVGLAAWHLGRPAVAEAVSIGIVSYLSRHFQVPCYFPHIGSREALLALSESRKLGTLYGAETCPHYLSLTVDAEAGVLAKVQPPLRTDEDRASVWNGISTGIISAIGSDHVPLTKAEKGTQSIWAARPGFGGTGMILPVMLTEGVAKGRISIRQLAALVSTSPAQLFGLYPTKGSLQPGSDADFVIVDMDQPGASGARSDLSASDFSVYDGLQLHGAAALTAVRGQVVYANGAITRPPGTGLYVRRWPEVELRATI